MGLFNTKMPYTNLHELNLDWLIEEVKDLKETVEALGEVVPATETPLEDSGTGAVGTSLKYAREDHVHPTDSKVTALEETSATHTEEINSAKGRLDVDEANIQTLFNNKQKKLVAGSNIIITAGSDADTISASGEIAVDYPSITNKPQINNVTLVGNQTSSDLNILHTVMLYSDGVQIYDDAEMTNALTFAQVKAILDNEANDVKLWNGNFLLTPEYSRSETSVTTIWFNGTTELNGKTYMYCIKIASDETVTSDEHYLINSTDVASKTAKGIVKIGDRISVSDDGTISADDQSYTLPTASADVLGGIKVGERLTIEDGVLSADEQTGGIFYGIDTENVIASGSGTTTYTATEDCWVVMTSGSINTATAIEIDGVRVSRGSFSGVNPAYHAPLKAGQVCSIVSASSYTIYGLKS